MLHYSKLSHMGVTWRVIPLDRLTELSVWAWRMRALGVLLLLLTGLTIGLAPGAAQASPCPFHAQMHARIAPAADRTEGLEDRTEAVTIVMATSFDRSETVPADPGVAHEVPDGACCHPAPIATAYPEPSLGPCASLSVSASCSAFRCWVEPDTDIYRPPALS